MTTYHDNVVTALQAEARRLVGGHIAMRTHAVRSAPARARHLAKLARYSARSR